jgi:hypothetical protein
MSRERCAGEGEIRRWCPSHVGGDALDDTSSVIMAEAAAIALAAKIFIALQVHEDQILSDNIVLLQYLCEQERIHPLIGE